MDALTHLSQRITGAGLDSSRHTRQISHLPVLTLKSAGGITDNPKTNVVVGVARVVVVAGGRTAIPRIVVPGTAAFAGLPHAYPTATTLIPVQTPQKFLKLKDEAVE